MKTITIDQKSMDAASAHQLDLDAIVEALGLPDGTDTIRCGVVDDHGFVVSGNYQSGDALLTISLAPDGPLAVASIPARGEALGRIVKAAARIASGRSRAITQAWKPFHHGNLLSFHADRFVRREGGGRSEDGRIVLRIDGGGKRIFAFLLDKSGVRDISTFVPDEALVNEALGLLPAFLATPVAGQAVDAEGTFSLDGRLPNDNPHQSTTQWYDTWFTPAQREFVDNQDDGGLRLLGAAGTGKTRTLVVKCLRMLRAEPPARQFERILFLTHATRTVEEIEEMILTMEGDAGIDLLTGERPRLSVQTIYDLASAHMGYNVSDISPISIDGQDGRDYQAILLNDAVDEFVRGNWVTFKSACSPPLRSYIEADRDSAVRRFFLWEILNEFACVLDADGIRTDTTRRQAYANNNRRRSWMWELPKREDREVVLALYDLFRAKLRSNGVIGLDQMVTDYMGYLETFRWEALQTKEGFDAIFVDELHLFNRQERMIFSHLLRNIDEAPRVYLAYDAKQSPRDTFLQLPSMEASALDLWKDAKLKKVRKIELADAFRYTPQIAATLRAIDAEFPGQNLGEDWVPYTAISKLPDGPAPTLYTLKNASEVYGQVFARARKLQADAKPGARIAVLCLSPSHFSRYLSRSEQRDRFTAIASRDDASGSFGSARKFIFSMPEYVAGLQFDTVLLIDVNKDEVPEGPMTSSARRHFASQVYLGASRAEHTLEFYATREGGGHAPLLSRALANDHIDELADFPD
ncbi:UvrD-helicase domain-containing protein [Luteibacter aegosomatissinici]|uniref:UvrD-helicase domain-containing protein n=1 Tax=Luteibacter aegosomatissinici TaxID=2911539 RepID=UPI001FFB6C97|nr:UvrD-helicase domain-containing protein [Luteibacter aegosomatissinici]UPG92816.1 AAA family ATPase [Luteibacter aegosomatissinici]